MCLGFAYYFGFLWRKWKCDDNDDSGDIYIMMQFCLFVTKHVWPSDDDVDDDNGDDDVVSCPTRFFRSLNR